MERNLLVAGFGGQGVMMLGTLLAQATCESTDKNVTYFPSYGAEMRGGTANCYVVISDESIGAPMADRQEDLIVMQIAWIKTGDWKVDYYQVFRAKSGGHFSSTPIYTTSGDIRYYINSKGLASGQTYCYKIRGIRVLNGVKVYTRWSNVVSAKVQ